MLTVTLPYKTERAFTAAEIRAALPPSTAPVKEPFFRLGDIVAAKSMFSAEPFPTSMLAGMVVGIRVLNYVEAGITVNTYAYDVALVSFNEPRTYSSPANFYEDQLELIDES